MLIVRKRYEFDQKNYFKYLYEEFGKIPENHLVAIKLRQAFFLKWILNRVKFLNLGSE